MGKDRPGNRTRLLTPLVRRSTGLSAEAQLRKLLGEFELRARVDDFIPELASELRRALEKKEPATGGYRDLAATKIRLAAALYLGRRISLAEYVFTVAHAVDSAHELSQSNERLNEISAEMERIERAHGLAKDEYWPIDEAPEEYRQLNRLWEEVSASQRQKAFDELEGREAAAILRRDPNEFDRLRERGRRAYFEREQLPEILVDTVIRYEREASAAASAGAYTAAITMIGAALEGMLLLKCLKSPKKLSSVLAALPTKERPNKPGSPERWTLDELIIVCHAAGWLPEIHAKSLVIHPAGLAQRLRGIRNHVHPGKVSKERPWIAAEARDYEEANNFYKTLYARVFRGRLLKTIAEVQRLV